MKHFDVQKDIRVVHKTSDILGITLAKKKHGGVFVRSAPNHKRIIRRGMTLISINKVDVTTYNMKQVVSLLKQRPLVLIFRPAPKGTAIVASDPNAPPPRPTLEDRVNNLRVTYLMKRK